MRTPRSTPLEALLDQVRLTWHVASRAAERLHRGAALTLGMRAVLEQLVAHGPATVPDLARRRRVTRQHVQALVDELAALGLVGLQANPAHRRSALVAATATGAATMRRLRQRERRFLSGVRLEASRRDLARAVEVLAQVVAALEARP